jgi:hypothetical protein
MPKIDNVQGNLKLCSTCGEWKELSKYHTYIGNGKKYTKAKCKKCIGEEKAKEKKAGLYSNIASSRETQRNTKADLQLKNLQKRLKTGIIVMLKDIPQKTIRKYEITGTNTRMIFLKDSQGKNTSYQWTDFLIGKLKIKICA